MWSQSGALLNRLGAAVVAHIGVPDETGSGESGCRRSSHHYFRLITLRPFISEDLFEILLRTRYPYRGKGGGGVAFGHPSRSISDDLQKSC